MLTKNKITPLGDILGQKRLFADLSQEITLLACISNNLIEPLQVSEDIFYHVKIKDIFKQFIIGAIPKIDASNLLSCGFKDQYLDIFFSDDLPLIADKTYNYLLDLKNRRDSLERIFRDVETVFDREKKVSSSIASEDLNVFYPDRLLELGVKQSKIGLSNTKFRFIELNKFIPRFNPKQIMLVLASSGTGKSFFAMQLARSIAESNNEMCCYVNLEMSAIAHLERACAIAFYKENLLSDYLDWKSYFTAHGSKEEFWNYGISQNEIVVDKKFINADELFKIISSLKRDNHNIKTIVIDHFHLLRNPVTSDENQAQVYNANYLLKLANECDVRVIALVQTRKSQATSLGQKEKGLEAKYFCPGLEDIRGSKAIPEIADYILSIWQEESNKNILNYKILKNRSGVDGISGWVSKYGIYLDN